MFGLQDAKCFCGPKGNYFKKHGEADPQKCILPCPGDKKQSCGGPSATKVFQAVVPKGLFTWNGFTRNDTNPAAKPKQGVYRFEAKGCICTGVIKPNQLAL